MQNLKRAGVPQVPTKKTFGTSLGPAETSIQIKHGRTNSRIQINGNEVSGALGCSRATNRLQEADLGATLVVLGRHLGFGCAFLVQLGPSGPR